ncbi:MAG: hypothetical protein KBD76_04665 [Bacteriovorax sp.]|jgi:hypothetical protein|nr:hypothetical protein [Bacteriovorax sp.]
MKKLLVLAFASIFSTSHSFALDKVTNSLAYGLAQSLYVSALGVASSQVTSLALTSKNQKAEAERIQNEAQEYYLKEKVSLFLESRIQLAKELDSSLTEKESVDLLVEASHIILNQ